MNIDQKIKQELDNEAAEMDKVLETEQGLFGLVQNIWHGRLRWWVLFTNVFVMVFTAAMAWTGYEFFTAIDTQATVFWGVWFILCVFAQAMLKLWLFMQMDRYSILREIKRQEMAIERLELSIVNSAQ